MKKLIIGEGTSNTLSFDLRDILGLIEEGEKFFWVIEEMNINYLIPDSVHPEISQNDYELLEMIMDSGRYEIKWNELVRIADLHIQIIDGKITGKYEEEVISIIAFDSGYWTVETDNKLLINNIEHRFKDSVSSPLF